MLTDFQSRLTQFSARASSNSLSSRYHTTLNITATPSIMSDICGRKLSHSLSPSAHHKHARDLSDEPMSPVDRACHHQSPSHEGHHEKRRQVTSCDNSPPPAQWVATTTGLLVHDPQDRCPECLEYQRHVSLDLILETPSIMVAHEDSLKSLAHLLGWSGHMANLRQLQG